MIWPAVCCRLCFNNKWQKGEDVPNLCLKQNWKTHNWFWKLESFSHYYNTNLDCYIDLMKKILHLQISKALLWHTSDFCKSDIFSELVLTPHKLKGLPQSHGVLCSMFIMFLLPWLIYRHGSSQMSSAVWLLQLAPDSLSCSHALFLSLSARRLLHKTAQNMFTASPPLSTPHPTPRLSLLDH